MKFKPALLHFKFDNFASLPSEIDDRTCSEIKKDCNGHKWKLELYPGGESEDDEPGWISLYLRSKNWEKLDVRYTFSVKDSNNKDVNEEVSFLKKKIDDEVGYGTDKFMKRSFILDTTNRILQNGALCIDVGIQVKDSKDYLFQPQSDHAKNMLNLLESGEKTDAFFNVDDKVFRVHSPIIHANAPLLTNHCDSDIQDIIPEVFLLLLEHIYSGCYPPIEHILEHGKEIIDAANKYELISLKIHVENTLVHERIMTKENVVDYILFADAQCCPLLKEYAMAFFSVHCRDIFNSEHSDCLKESGDLISEIILLVHPSNGAFRLTVNELRKELGKLKLDVDGSKDALVSRLKEAKAKKENTD